MNNSANINKELEELKLLCQHQAEILDKLHMQKRDLEIELSCVYYKAAGNEILLNQLKTKLNSLRTSIEEENSVKIERGYNFNSKSAINKCK